MVNHHTTNTSLHSHIPAKLFTVAPTWRVLSHLRKFLKTGEVPKNNRGGQRIGQSLLDCEAFKEKASLWVKEQIALHQQRRLRAVRKSASFKSQKHLPIEQKTSHSLSSARFQAYVEDTLLAEFYSEDAVRARAKSAAISESKYMHVILHMRSSYTCMYYNRHDS